jgi:hypothetical protein
MSRVPPRSSGSRSGARAASPAPARCSGAARPSRRPAAIAPVSQPRCPQPG